MKRLALLLMFAAAFAFAFAVASAEASAPEAASAAKAAPETKAAAPQDTAQTAPEGSKPAKKAKKAKKKKAVAAVASEVASAPKAAPDAAAQAPETKAAPEVAAQAPEAKAEPETKAEAPAAAAAPAKEERLEGVIDVGARWVSSVGGDLNTYRSIVNLQSGPRVVNVDLKYDPAPHENNIADSFLLQAHSWGDPYNTMRLDMKRNRIYDLTASYSNISYFNDLPSYADQNLLTGGVFMNQRAYDTKVRDFENELLLLPGFWIQPYVAYSRNSSTGMGISTLVDATNNQYPIVNNVHWGQNTFRGGVRVQLRKLHLTFEQGSNVFKDDQGAYSNGFGTGDRTTPYFGQLLDLTNGWQAYYIRGDGNFTKGYGTFSPTSWIDLYGQIYHSDPHLSSTLNQLAQGNIPAAAPNLAFYSTAFDNVYGSAAMPRTSGSLSMELRILNRVRIREAFETDSYHDDSSSTLNRLFYLSSGLAANSSLLSTGRLDVNQHRSQTEALVDITKKLMVRGGYRYEWGSANVPAGLLAITSPDENGKLERHVGLAGIQYRPTQRIVLNADLEASNGVKTFYRTGLQDYTKLRVQSRFTLPQNLFFTLGVNYLNNHNPDSGMTAKFTSAVESASLQWLPGNHRISLIADYTHSEIRSDINYIVIFPFNPLNESLYVDNDNSASLMAEIALPGRGLVKPRLSFGGSMVATAGSRPSRYYQPQGKLLVPLSNHFQLYGEWQYYGLNQPFYFYEGFRAHTLMTGVRFLM